MSLTHQDICRITADLAYEEQMKQTNNVPEEPTDCPYYNADKAVKEGKKTN